MVKMTSMQESQIPSLSSNHSNSCSRCNLDSHPGGDNSTSCTAGDTIPEDFSDDYNPNPIQPRTVIITDPAGFDPSILIAFIIVALTGVGLVLVSRATKPKISPGEELKWPSSPQPGRKPAESEITSGLQGTAAGSKLASQKDPMTAPIPEEATTKKKKKKKITAEGIGDGLTQQGMLEPPKKSLAPEEQATPRKKKKRKGTTEGAVGGATEQQPPPTKKSLAPEVQEVTAGAAEGQGETKRKRKKKSQQ